ncbi:hypothetical protein DPEC_G00162310 [Dallia pectoralis]|uniref:Uncharacterized protein n=1 Tax=Dallia pectoralis TaxID=75939 RepID=A0ACC2GGN6_DALPE|nr:hypothetical protein DPEC_G00162310 [Dallia pectoralis]
MNVEYCLPARDTYLNILTSADTHASQNEVLLLCSSSSMTTQSTACLHEIRRPPFMIHYLRNPGSGTSEPGHITGPAFTVQSPGPL